MFSICEKIPAGGPAYRIPATTDTLLICGTSMSGCVRATATDAFMRDIHAMIVREGVADRSEAVMESNLFDVD
jgi:maleamate amidohydrolase